MSNMFKKKYHKNLLICQHLFKIIFYNYFHENFVFFLGIKTFNVFYVYFLLIIYQYKNNLFLKITS